MKGTPRMMVNTDPRMTAYVIFRRQPDLIETGQKAWEDFSEEEIAGNTWCVRMFWEEF